MPIATNTCLSRQKTFSVATKVCLLRQNICGDKIMFVATKPLSQQRRVCLDKRFLSTSILLSCLSEQDVCRDKITFVSRKTFVVTKASILLSRQKTCLVATNTCLSRHNKNLSRQVVRLHNLWLLPPVILTSVHRDRIRSVRNGTPGGGGGESGTYE